MGKVLIWLASGDLAKLRPGIVWGSKAAESGWVDEVRFVVFGAAEQTLVQDDELFEAVLAVQHTTFCKAVADDMQLTESLQAKGGDVVYVGMPIATAINEGWQVLVF
jgi:hypothetical protein